ncbi:hypothetical protein CH333_00305 [candidate division WOR-3 bacterium JGI_Cruoil_03_44_89]|mgnify:CR=1 FL=1|uniref:Uncharacterized protein n=1 Tax=candidate division WOR-3 bacterium JGI_Cruoil_03_44_89 TaxID=1973748 RepID=A0A235BZF8_UNCW3|nr:MAG: hypothetical protein CH333_00305 [candidate division WOR-3 bacterium JGI_Cruoil_03_44_89]
MIQFLVILIIGVYPRYMEYEVVKSGEMSFWRMDKVRAESFIPKVDISFYGFGLYDGARKRDGIFEAMIREGFPIHPHLKGEVNIGTFDEIGDGQQFLAYYDPLLEPKYVIHNFETQSVISDIDFDVRVEKAYLLFDKDDMSIGIGRNRLKIGPGYKSNLLLSGRGQPLDFLYNAEVRRGPLHLFVFNAGIEDSTGEKRIACQRMELCLSCVTIGITEAVLHRKENFLKYVNPLEFYYITQRRGKDNDDNLVASGDITFTKNGKKYYLEFLFDDPIIFHEDRPFKGGAMLGAYFTDFFGIPSSDFRIETTVIPRWTYTHDYSNQINAMEVNGIPMGFFGGSDCIHIYTEFTKYWTQISQPGGCSYLPTTYLSFILEYLAHGDGRLNVGWEDERDKYPQPRKIRIPSGCKEERLRAGIEGNLVKEKFSITTGAYIERIRNYKNQDGNDFTRASIKIAIFFTLPR